jgi:hypothetical protein
METITTDDRTREQLTAAFDALRALFAERMRELETDNPEDDLIVDAMTEVARREGVVDRDTILRTLITFARRDELRHLATRVAILGFEKFGQKLELEHLKDERAA